MQIVHPMGMYQNMPPENVFIALDDMGNEIGLGYIIFQFQPNLYPDCPINLYFKLDCQPIAQYMLLGALMAQARRLREYNPQLGARVYTDIHPRDQRMIDFYEHAGFYFDDAEVVLRMPMPLTDGRIQMSCSTRPTPVNTPQEQQALLYRLQQNDINYVDLAYLQQLMMKPHFVVLGLYRNIELVGEVIMAGEGDHCDLVAIYITPPCRYQGMGHGLLQRCMAMMAAEGVTNVTTCIMTRSLPQKRLMDAMGAQIIDQKTIFPGLKL